MSFARLRLVLAAAAFIGWLGLLGVTVYQAVYRPARPPVLSRAQLTAATHVVVADVTLDGDLPAEAVTVAQVVRGDGVAPGAKLTVAGLSAAMPPGADRFPGGGQYLLPLTRAADEQAFRVAGLPRSPGYDKFEYGGAAFGRPPVYPWSDEVKAQLRDLGLLP